MKTDCHWHQQDEDQHSSSYWALASGSYSEEGKSSRRKLVGDQSCDEREKEAGRGREDGGAEASEETCGKRAAGRERGSRAEAPGSKVVAAREGEAGYGLVTATTEACLEIQYSGTIVDTNL